MAPYVPNSHPVPLTAPCNSGEGFPMSLTSLVCYGAFLLTVFSVLQDRHHDVALLRAVDDICLLECARLRWMNAKNAEGDGAGY